MTKTNANASIIKKIQGLIAIANDEKNDEESQSAFMMAQRLMIKHSIAESDVVEVKPNRDVNTQDVTVYKQLHWWEQHLANIISENFRVKWYYSEKTLYGERRVKRKIVFLGLKDDLELAKEMYILAYEVLVHYAKEAVKDFYVKDDYRRTRAMTTKVKDSYMRGFLSGMAERFKEQVADMQQEFGLVLLMPVEVKEKYDVMFPTTKKHKGVSFRLPNAYDTIYQDGYGKGKEVDYTKSTLDGDY